MRSFYFGFIFCLLVFAHIGCSDNSAANESKTEEAIPAALPELNDANQALAEGNRLLDSTETEKAIEAFSRAVSLDPDLAEAHFQLGIAYALIETRDANEVDIEATPTPDPKEKRPREAKTNSEKAFENAVEAYKKLIAKNENDDVAHFNLGRSYNKLNEDENSAKSLREAVRLKPEDTQYQTELGAILVKLAKYGEAIGPLKKALELDSSNSKAEELLSDAQAGQKRIGFSAKKDEKKGESSNSNIQNSNSAEQIKPSESNTRKPALPANTP